MYTKRFAFLGAIAMVAMVGCETATGPENDAVQVTSEALTVATSDSPVLDLGNGFAVVGSSKVTRNKNGATATLHADGLTSGNAYTMWMVMFNNPNACVVGTPCGEVSPTETDIVPGTDAVVDVIYLTGHVVGGDDQATFSGYLSKGDTSGSLFSNSFGAPAPGLSNPLGAEIWLIVRDHGPGIPGQIPNQIQTFEGACTPGTSFGLGDGGTECADVLLSIHQP